MKEKFGYLPPEQRKKILLICDDIRVFSGISTIAREIVVQTAHHFNYVNIAGAISHPEKGTKLDLSEDTNKNANITDASVIAYPVDGYGNTTLIRQLIQLEKPDAIMLITDPRYFTWLFAIENEIRKQIPIVYLSIWDSMPCPLYNLPYYEACDLLMGISKQTHNIHKMVLDHGNTPYRDLDKDATKTQEKHSRLLKYVPHGLNHEVFKPLGKDNDDVKSMKTRIFGKFNPEFVVFFNSRNIRRKQIPDTLMAFRLFLDSLPKEKADKCALLLHTEKISDHGTDLPAVIDLLFGEKYSKNVVFTNIVASTQEMSLLYNLSDVQILLTSNEGWGLSLTEAILCGKPIIANTTGGMQDQMRFEFEDGTWINFDDNFPSNHRGTYKKHGKWAFPVYPTSNTMVGSPPTPYIFDDTCRPEDAAIRISEVYNLSEEERVKRGLAGREWALSEEAGFTSIHQANRVIEAFDELFNTWTPREKFEFINVNDSPKRILKHKLVY
jgi:glycosyltransferase involved in cell wall biosynthesis